MNTSQALEIYVEECKYRGLSEKTIEGYVWAVEHMIRQSSEFITDKRQLMKLINRSDLAEESRKDLWQRLKTFYRWMEREGLLPEKTYRLSQPNVRDKFPRTLTADDIRRLFQSCQDRRDRALITIALDTGVRLGELASMTWTRIYQTSMQVTGKTGPRTIPLSQQARQSLIGSGDAEAVWLAKTGAVLTTSGIQQAIRRIMYRANILPPKAGPHLLRHTFGRLYILNGGDVFSLQRIMGHRKLETTMIYVYMNSEDLIAQHAKFSPIANLAFLEDYAQTGIQTSFR